VEEHVSNHGYHPISLQQALSASERELCEALLEEWHSILGKARQHRDAAAKRRRAAD
jgi:hypothetical protein